MTLKVLSHGKPLEIGTSECRFVNSYIFTIIQSFFDARIKHASDGNRDDYFRNYPKDLRDPSKGTYKMFMDGKWLPYVLLYGSYHYKTLVQYANTEDKKVNS